LPILKNLLPADPVSGARATPLRRHPAASTDPERSSGLILDAAFGCQWVGPASRDKLSFQSV